MAKGESQTGRINMQVDVAAETRPIVEKLATQFGSRTQVVGKTLDFLASADPAIRQVIFARDHILAEHKEDYLRRITAYFAGLMEMGKDDPPARTPKGRLANDPEVVDTMVRQPDGSFKVKKR